MNSEIGKKIEVYSLDELPKVGEGFKFFLVLVGVKIISALLIVLIYQELIL